jgi:phage FluMu protein Com
LPDGDIVTKERLNTIRSGYDHYWRFHKTFKEWIEFGCPQCKELSEYSDKTQ